MALLDDMLNGGGMGEQNPFAQYKQMQANPFTQQIPGTEYLGGFGNDGNMGAFGGGGMGQQQSDVPTDFAGVPPGLPNLPESLQGFGFGQTAPEMNTNTSLRQNLIQNLLRQIMQGQGDGMMNGQGNMGGF